MLLCGGMPKNPEQDLDQKANENEGEGGKTAAREYDKKATEHAKSGKVDKAAREAADAVAGREGSDLRDAEEVGKSHIAEEDPEFRR